MDNTQALSILEIDDAKDADKAFRNKSKEVHPDLGGDRDAFELLRLAHDTLKNKKKSQSAEELFVSTFNNVLSKVRDPFTANLITRTVDLLRLDLNDIKQQIAVCKANMQLIQQIADRIACKRENNILEHSLLERYIEYEKSVHVYDERIETINSAIKLSLDYSYEVEMCMNNLGGR